MRALTLKGSKEIKVHMHIHSSWVQYPNIILYLIIIRHLMAKITFSLTWSKGMACVQTPLPSDFSWGEEGSVHRIAKKGTKHAEHDGMGTLWWYCDAQIQHQPFFSIYPASEYAQTVHEITDHPRTDRTAEKACIWYNCSAIYGIHVNNKTCTYRVRGLVYLELRTTSLNWG